MNRDDMLESCLALNQARTLEDFYRHIDDYTRQLGFDQFLYTAVPSSYRPENSDSPLTLLSSYDSGWLEYYLDKRYEQDDVSIHYCLSGCDAPYIWRRSFDVKELTQKQRNVFLQAGEAGLRSGFSIPMHHQPGVIGAAAFTTDSSLSDFELLYKERSQRAISFIYAFNDAVLSLYAPHFGQRHLPMLTARESDVLHWLAAGQTYETIADSLAVGASTVRKHASRIIAKLGARNSTHACVLALRWGLIK